MAKADRLTLPEKIDSWKLSGPPQTITRETIFDYMDGGGELYLAYKFDRLLVFKYLDEAENEILVEIYEMRHPDEAFGLLSLDWTGEPVVLKEETARLTENPVAPVYTALYGQGLLRARVDNLYLRILAQKESPGVRETILKLGQIVASASSGPALPELLKIIRPKAGSDWQIKKDRTSYFHSHLILNSLFYLSHENILHLESDCEAVYTEWTAKTGDHRRTVRLVVISYPERQKAETALTDFIAAYLQEKSGEATAIPLQEREKAVELEDGWLGWKLSGNLLALVFEAPEKSTIDKLFAQLDLK